MLDLPSHSSELCVLVPFNMNKHFANVYGKVLLFYACMRVIKLEHQGKYSINTKIQGPI